MKPRLPWRPALGLTAAATVVALAAAPSALAADAATTVALSKAGDTRITLDKGVARALTSLGVGVSPTPGAKVKGGAIAFPITGGMIDPKTAAGTYDHAGGVQFKAGATKVRLLRPRIVVDRTPSIFVKAGGASLEVFHLDLSKARITRPGLGTKVSGVGVKLTRSGAKALNSAFHVQAFKRGMRIGSAVVDAKPAQLILEEGSTSVALDGGTLGVLTGAGVTPGIVAPGTLTGTTASFPIAPSKVAADLSSGTVRHTGGISLSKAGTTARVTDFDIRLGTAPTLAAAVNGGSPKVPILDLDLSQLDQEVKGTTVVLGNIPARISTPLSGTLTSVFALPATAGATLGTATVAATVR